jgi:anti-sigma factor RsiW
MAVIEFPINRHPNDDQREGYSMGTLNAKEVAELEEHLLICEICQVRLRDIDAFVEAMRSAASVYRREQSTRRPAAKPVLARAGSSQ